ncbi:flippase [Priestia megaterium]|uniref:flippase n=1 Tax=Priestia megaterium TaxID=1404 RepID=UPI003D03DDF4
MFILVTGELNKSYNVSIEILNNMVIAVNIKKNYLFNLIYQVLTMILPLVTVPYVSRVLNPDGVGTFAYTSSIVQYFILFGTLGISTYGVKQIAINRDDKKELSKTFVNIYCLQLILTSISLIIYIIFVLLFFHEYKIIALLQIIMLLSAVIQCSWFFSGLEEFKQIVIRNILVKIVSLIAVFIFVRKPDDLALYTVIMGFSSLIGQLVMWFYIKEYVILIKVSFKSIFSHLRPTLVYFLPQLAIQVYFLLDKTMLGVISGTSEVGVYDYADKILKIALAIVTSLGVVMLPRMANTVASGNIEKAREYIISSLQFSTLLAVPIMFGIAGISKEFVPWFLGEEFKDSILVLTVLSPVILLMAWGGVLGTQFLIPFGKMKEYTISLYVGVVINILVNLMLIKPYGAIGAAVGTLCTECAVVLMQMVFITKILNTKNTLSQTYYYFIAGIIMFGGIRIIGEILGISILTTLIQVLVGGGIYLIVIICFEFLLKKGLVLGEIKRVYSIKITRKKGLGQ